MHSHIIGHIVRRGIQHAQKHFTGREEYMNKLRQDAQLYEQDGPEMELKPRELMPVIITGVVAMLVIWSVGTSL